VAGVGVVGLEYLEPFGGLRGSFDDPESRGGVEQARLQDLGLPVLALGVAAAVGEDDVDAGEQAVLARLELGEDWLRAVCWDNPVALFGEPGLGQLA